MINLFPLLLSFGYRARGGAIPLNNDTLARLIFWAIPCGLCIALIAGPIFGILGLIGAFAGIILGHGFAQKNTLSGYLSMALIGYTRLLLMTCMLVVCKPVVILFLPLGCLQGLAYYLGYNVFNKYTLKLFGITWCVPNDASWGEFLTGLFFGITFILMLII